MDAQTVAVYTAMLSAAVGLGFWLRSVVDPDARVRAVVVCSCCLLVGVPAAAITCGWTAPPWTSSARFSARPDKRHGRRRAGHPRSTADQAPGPDPVQRPGRLGAPERVSPAPTLSCCTAGQGGEQPTGPKEPGRGTAAGSPPVGAPGRGCGPLSGPGVPRAGPGAVGPGGVCPGPGGVSSGRGGAVPVGVGAKGSRNAGEPRGRPPRELDPSCNPGHKLFRGAAQVRRQPLKTVPGLCVECDDPLHGRPAVHESTAFQLVSWYSDHRAAVLVGHAFVTAGGGLRRCSVRAARWGAMPRGRRLPSRPRVRPSRGSGYPGRW